MHIMCSLSERDYATGKENKYDVVLASINYSDEGLEVR